MRRLALLPLLVSLAGCGSGSDTLTIYLPGTHANSVRVDGGITEIDLAGRLPHLRAGCALPGAQGDYSPPPPA